MLYGKQGPAFHRIRISMYIMRRITLPVKFTLRLIGRCLEQSVARIIAGLIHVLIFNPVHGGSFLHFDADAKKTTCAGLFRQTKRERIFQRAHGRFLLFLRIRGCFRSPGLTRTLFGHVRCLFRYRATFVRGDGFQFFLFLYFSFEDR